MKKLAQKLKELRTKIFGGQDPFGANRVKNQVGHLKVKVNEINFDTALIFTSFYSAIICNNE